MIKKLCVYTTLCLLNFSFLTFANDNSYTNDTTNSTGYPVGTTKYTPYTNYTSDSTNYSPYSTSYTRDSTGYVTAPVSYPQNSVGYSASSTNYTTYTGSTPDSTSYSPYSTSYVPDSSGYSVSSTSYAPYTNYSADSLNGSPSSTSSMNYPTSGYPVTPYSTSYAQYPTSYAPNSTDYSTGSVSYPDSSGYSIGSTNYTADSSSDSSYSTPYTPTGYPIATTPYSTNYTADSSYTPYSQNYGAEPAGYSEGSAEYSPYSTNYAADAPNYSSNSTYSPYPANSDGYAPYSPDYSLGYANYSPYPANSAGYAPYSPDYSLGYANDSPYSSNYDPESTDDSFYSPRYWLDSLSNYCSFNCLPNFFVGLGGSYNSVRFDQYLSARSVSTVTTGPTLVATGDAGGHASPFHRTHCTFAPELQFGFFKDLPCSNWLWGAKFVYRYLDVTFTENNSDFPSRVLTSADPIDTFIGFTRVGSSQTAVNHELSLLAFIGHSFTCGHIYVGAGPVVFGTRSKIFKATGFTEVNGIALGVTGNTVKFTRSKWLWGGAAQVGMVYYFAPCWFLDVNYYFAVTGRHKFKNSSSFSSSTGGLLTTTGTLSIKSAQRITAQSLTLSINKVF